MKSPSKAIVLGSAIVVAAASLALWHSTGSDSQEQPSVERVQGLDVALTPPEEVEDVAGLLEGARIAAPEEARGVGESEASSSREGLLVRRGISELAIQNIKARQPTILEGMDYLTGEKEFEREESYAHHASNMAQYAIMVIYDAEGRSHTLNEGRHGVAGSGIRPKDALRADGVKFHRIHSSGHEYLVPHGEFPDFDHVKKLIGEHSLGVPFDEVPLESVIQLCNTALAYRTE